MNSLIYDGTWTGFLSAIFEVYERKLTNVSICTASRFQPGMFGQVMQVTADDANAKRVWTGLKKCLSGAALQQIYAVHLSELPESEDILLSFIRLVFDKRESPETDFGHPAVLKISQINRMVHREKHRMEAFVRFHLTRDSLYYAGIEPDFNVLPLILKHFKNRYADQKWLIYDLKRHYGIYYDLCQVEEVTLSLEKKVQPGAADLNIFHEDEALYQTLWKSYFQQVNITERKNTKLHVQHVPKRYWKHLTEKYHG